MSGEYSSAWTGWTAYWSTGPVSTDWSDPADWRSDLPPGAGDDVVIADTGMGSDWWPQIGQGTTENLHILSLQDVTLTIAGTLDAYAVQMALGSRLSLAGGVIDAGHISGLDAPWWPGISAHVSGYGTVSGSIDPGVAVQAQGGVLTVNGAGAGGTFSIAPSSTLVLNGATPAEVELSGSESTLVADQPLMLTGRILIEDPSTDVIDLVGLAATSVTYDGSHLVVGYGANQSLTLNVVDVLAGNTPVTSSDGAGGTLIKWSQIAQTWTPELTGDWSVASNWRSGATPGSSDDVLIDSGWAQINAGTTANARSLSLNDGEVSVAGALTVAASIDATAGYLQLTGGTITAAAIHGDSQDYSLRIDGAGTLNASISGHVFVTARGALAINGDVTGSTPIYVTTGSGGAQGKLELNGAGSEQIYLQAAKSTVQLDQAEHFSGTIYAFRSTDVLDLRDIVATNTSYDGSVLTVSYGASQTLTLNLKGSLLGYTPTLADDGQGGTKITWTAPNETWSVYTGTDWSQASNWNSGRVPGASDDALIASPLAQIGSSTVATVHSLVLATTLDLNGQLDASSNVTLEGVIRLAGTLNAPQIVGAAGAISGWGVVDGDVSGVVGIDAQGDKLTLNGDVLGGQVLFGFASEATLEFNGAGAPFVEFLGAQKATLLLDRPLEFTGTIADLGAGDAIDLAGIVATNVSYTGTTLAVSYGAGQTLSLTIGTYPGMTLRAGLDGAGGTKLTWLNDNAFTGNDFGADRHADLLWQKSNGDLSTWATHGITALTMSENVSYDAAPASSWQLQGTFDVDRNGTADLLWHNSQTGQIAVWSSALDGSGFHGSFLSEQVDLSWSPTTTGDFSGDGRDDILWRNANGQVSEWQSTGTGFAENTFLESVSTSWHIQGVGDFDGDGKADVLWRNDSGALSVWSGTATGFTENSYYDAGPDTSWHVAAVADFTGDGKADILWRNTNGALSEWQSNGSGFTQNTYYDASVGNDWHVVGAFDFNADGRADILWRNDNGTFSIWESNGPGFTQAAYTDSSVASDWTIVAHHYDIV